MDDISSFARTLTKLERLMAKLDMAVSNTRCMFSVKNMELTYDVSLRVAELMEKAVLVARALPAYTGAPDAAMMVARQTASVVHVEIGFTDEGWFSLRMPMLLPKKNMDQPTIFVLSCSLKCSAFSTTKPPVGSKIVC